jgi:DNA primase
MGLIPESVIEEVLARADIVDTVRHYVNIKKAGKSFKGICPFHDDHDPSLKIHPGKQIYKCFACGAGGNAIGFVMEIEGWSFPEAVRTLAERHGVEIPDEDPEAARRARKRRDKKQQYYATMEAAGDFYENNLWSDRGRGARMYLEERGIDEETAREFGLGYAPDGWEHLLGHLSQKGIDGEQAEQAGLALARKNSPGHYDRFRHRIVFPVVDIWRNIRAFGGRTLSEEDDVPKYMNSPETDFYTKGEHLYGLHVAKKHFQQTDYALVVEGNFDVIALHAWGFQTAVAPMGTALTERQAELLSRYARTVVVAFDGDEAGAEATRRCIPALQAAGLEGKVIRFDELDDPDSFVRREGSEALEEKIQEAQPMIGWAIDEVLVEDGAPVEEKVGSLEQAADVLNEVDNSVVWQHYAQEISRKLDIEPDLLEEYLQRPQSNRRQQVREAIAQADEPLELTPAETSLLSVLLEHPEWIDHFLDGDYDIMLASEPLAGLLRTLDEHYREHEELKAALLVEQIDRPPLRQTLLEALDTESDEETDDLTYYEDCIRSIQRNYAERGLRHIEDLMDGLDPRQDRDEFEQLNEKWCKFRDLKNESVGTPPRNR